MIRSFALFAIALIPWLCGCQTLAQRHAANGQFIEAIGVAHSPQDDPRGLARMRLIEAAEEDARAEIRRQLGTLEARPGQTILEAMEANPYVWSRIMGLLKSTKAEEQQIIGGQATVRLRIPFGRLRDIALYGEEA